MLKYIEALILSGLMVFAPIKAALITVLVLIVFDTITGVYAAYKRKEAITSSGLKRTLGKILLYELALCLAFLCEQYLTGDIVPVSKMISGMVGLVELKSILENMDSISGTNLFQAAIDKIVQKQTKE